MSTVKEKPVRFDQRMVLALLASQMTMFRYVIQPQPHAWSPTPESLAARIIEDCPYGQVGDRLWVREALYLDEESAVWRYKADGAVVQVEPEYVSDVRVWAHHRDDDICKATHMPRFASRILLEISDIKIERLQQIAAEEARTEGFKCNSILCAGGPGTKNGIGCWCRDLFQENWDKTSGKPTQWRWKVDPWVGAVSFKRI